MVEGYLEVYSGTYFKIVRSVDVRALLDEVASTKEKDVNKVVLVLRRLADLGHKGVNNTEFFRHEGKFKTGLSRPDRVAVYAVKSHQVRIYGGFATIDGCSTFVCVEAAVKKKDKADPAQLVRVARRLGEINAAL